MSQPGAELQLWELGLRWVRPGGDGGGCGGRCHLRAQERDSGAPHGTRGDDDTARWMAFSNECILRPRAGHGDSPFCRDLFRSAQSKHCEPVALKKLVNVAET